jgi:catechol 2,3-dioxygenase-like lactoylglutathione lyase family enzyme
MLFSPQSVENIRAYWNSQRSSRLLNFSCLESILVGGAADSGLQVRRVMSSKWYARPVLFVADIDRSVDFYVKQLGFSHPWRYEEEGKAWVAQVERQGCELILSSQWPDKVGKGLMFISLDLEVLNALRAELETRGVEVKDGNWGYRLMVIVDPDGNELYFPYPSDVKEGGQQHG